MTDGMPANFKRLGRVRPEPKHVLARADARVHRHEQKRSAARGRSPACSRETRRGGAGSRAPRAQRMDAWRSCRLRTPSAPARRAAMPFAVMSAASKQSRSAVS